MCKSVPGIKISPFSNPPHIAVQRVSACEMNWSYDITGRYESPKAAKERVTRVPSKYKFTYGTGRGYSCMYMAIAISNRHTLSILIFGK